MDDLRARLRAIENDLDRGTYQPGPWGALMRTIRQQPPDQRAALAADISRVSNKLHRRKLRYTLPVAPAYALELGGTLLGLSLLRRGVARASWLRTATAAGLLSLTGQPLVKVALGSALDVNYAYAYAVGIEPKFKMQYGSYVAAPTWKRIAVQLGGTLGTPLALALVGSEAAAATPRTARVCRALAWIMTLIQVALFIGGLVGVRSVGKEALRMTSGGAAGGELRDALRH